MINTKPVRGLQLNRSHPFTRGLVGCWAMNEGCGDKVFDLSGNGNTGTIYGGAPWVAGKFGHCIDFQGINDYIGIPDAPEFDVDWFSVILWYKRDTLGSYLALIGRDSEVAGDRYFHMYTSNANKLYADVWNSSDSYVGVSATSAVSAGIWYQGAIIYNGHNVFLYHNGILEGTSNALADLKKGDQQISIGCIGIATMWSDCKIDFVMFYNRALAASEIAHLYREPFCMFESAKVPADVAATPAAGTHQRHIGFRPVEGADRLRNLLRAG